MLNAAPRPTSLPVRGPLRPRVGDAFTRSAIAAQLATCLRRATQDQIIESGIAVVGNLQDIAVASAGRINGAGSDEVGLDTLWDLASLTKVVGVTPAVLKLIESSKLSLDTRIG